MAGSLNRAEIIGNLGADPESRAMPSGAMATNIRIATTESWIDKQTKEKKEDVQWHSIAFFGRLAEVAAEYLKKGDKVFVAGKLRTRKWQDKSGNDRYTTEIIANEMVMLGSPSGQRRQGGSDDRQQGDDHRPPQDNPRGNLGGGGSPPAGNKDGGKEDEWSDSIPF